MTVRILVGDARARLRDLPDRSVHCVVCSPPYWSLRSYLPEGHPDKHRELGLESTPAAYVANLVAVFREVRRVLRDDGTLWLVLGDSFATGAGKVGAHPGGGAQGARWKGRTTPPNRLPLPGLKPKDLVGIPWQTAFALRHDGWYLRSDIVWCLSQDTRVYVRTQKRATPMTIRDMARLDPRRIHLWTGEKWSRVLGWSRVLATESLRITLRSGEVLCCTRDHKWPLSDGRLVAASELSVGDTLATCSLPSPESSCGAGIDYDLAWFAGLYLAEGSMSGECIQIAGHLKETVRHHRLRKVVERYGGSARTHRSSENGVMIQVRGGILRGTLNHFLAGRTARDKHLHPRAWAMSNQHLRALLEGYLDGDGHHLGYNGRWQLRFTRNHALANDLRTLATRLDFALTLKPTFSKIGRTRQFESYQGGIRFGQSGHPNERNRAEILKIERGHGLSKVFYDIGIADEPHLFALASGILTHNSKPNTMPESVRDRPTRAHEFVFLLTKSERYFFDAEAVREPFAPATIKRIAQATFDRQTGGAKDGLNPNRSARRALVNLKGRALPEQLEKRPHKANGRNIRSVWSLATEPFAGKHYATYPRKLVAPCIKAGTSERGCCRHCGAPWGRVIARQRKRSFFKAGQKHDGTYYRPNPGGGIANDARERREIGWQPSCRCPAHDPVPCTVLDPFGGAGTTALVAAELGRDAILIELSANYAALAADRLARATVQVELSPDRIFGTNEIHRRGDASAAS